MLILSLIIDDVPGKQSSELWNIYYHIFIDHETYAILVGQAKKLLAHAASLGAWNHGPYSAIVRFSDSYNLQKVAGLWELCAIKPTQADRFQKIQTILKQQ